MKLNIGRTILVGLAFFTVCIFWEAYDALMPLFLADFGLNKTIVGFVMALDNIFALFLLPLMGLLSDRTHTRLGRRIPFIVVGATLAGLLLLLLNFAHNLGVLWLLLLATVLLLLAMCLYRTPAVSLMPDVTPKPIRSKANAIINIMGLVGGLVFMAGYKVLDILELTAQIGHWALISVISFLMIAAAAAMVLTVKENKMVAEREQAEREAGIEQETAVEQVGFFKGLLGAIKALSPAERTSYILLMLSVFLWFFGFNAAKTWMSSFASEALGGDFAIPLMVAGAVGFLCYIPSSILGGKIGRRNTVIVGLALLAVGLALAVVFVGAGITGALLVGLFYVVFGFVGAGWAMLNVHSYVMSVEFAKKGETGFFTGNYYAFSMGAQALTPIISGALYEVFGVNAIFPYSLAFVVLSIVTMLFVRHGNVGSLGESKKQEQ